MYSEPSIARRLPPEHSMDRDDALDAFLAVVNTVQPDHPYRDDPWPIGRRDVDYGVTRTYYARCGPRPGPRYVVGYLTRMTHINRINRVEHLALLTHEITHIPFGNNHGRQHGGHPPEFWREMAFHALEFRDAIQDGVLDDIFGDVDVDAYLKTVVGDPSKSTVDRRYWSVEECKAEVANLIGVDQ